MSIAQTLTIARKDLAYLFTSPVVVVFAVVFMLLTGSITIYTGNFIDRNQADLQSLFQYIPWILTIMMPALAMRAFSEEYQLGTIENLFALPVDLRVLVAGKFLAVLMVASLVALTSTSFYISIAYLGNPDHGAAISGYIGVFLLMASYLALGIFASVVATSQVIAFIVGASLCFIFTALGAPIVNHFFVDILPGSVFSFVVSLSLLSNFQQLTKGVMGLPHIIFFASFIFLGLFLANLCLKQRKKGKSFLSLHASLAVLGFFVVNFTATHMGNWRLDFTQQKLFTLSHETQTLLSSLETPSTVTFYYSNRLDEIAPAYSLFAARVRSLLIEMENASNGNIDVKFTSPIPFGSSEDDAIEAGLQGIPLEDGSKIYIGIHIHNDLSDEAIPILQPNRENFIEYDIVKLIAQVQQKEKPPIGLISSLPVLGMPDFSGQTQGLPAWVAFEEAQEIFDITSVFRPEEVLEQNWRLLLLFHPSAEQMTDEMLYALDQYILKGGKLLVFADPHAQVQATGFGGMSESSSVMVTNALLSETGISMAEQVLGDPELAVVVNIGDQLDPQNLPYVSWTRLGASQLNSEISSSAQITELLLATPGIINIEKENPDIQVTELLSSSSSGVALSPEDFAEDIPDIQGLYNHATNAETPKERRLLALRISGEMQSAFTEGAPTPEQNAAQEEDTQNEQPQKEAYRFPPHISQSQAPFSLTLVTDTDFLRDRFWVRTQNLLGQRIAIPERDNGAWLLNLLEEGSDHPLLLGIRGKGVSARPFTRFEELQQQANLAYLAEEQELRLLLEENENKLSELDPEDESTKEISVEVRQALIETRQKLRDVQLKLRQSEEQLIAQITYLNIGFLPTVLLLCSLVVAIIRYRRRKTLHAIAN